LSSEEERMSFSHKQNKHNSREKGKQTGDPGKMTAPEGFPENLFILQRTIGNQGVGDMLDGIIQRQTSVHGETGYLQESEKVLNPRIQFGPARNGCGTEVTAILVHYDSTEGTSSSRGEMPGWWIPPGRGQFWVKGHLLNQFLGGPAEPRNLTPLTSAANARHKTYVETAAREAFAAGHALKYHVKAVYDGPKRSYFKGDDTDPPESIWHMIATGLLVELKVLDSEGNEIPRLAKPPVFIENMRV
jgi:hypothetical protein